MGLKIAKSWFERKRIDDQITVLWEPYVHPFLRCNIWHIPGKESDLLIDTGMGIASLYEAAQDLFQKPLSVVITHTHIDHSGGAHEFDTCYVHQAEAESLSKAQDQLSLATKHWPKDLVQAMEEDSHVGDYVITARPSENFIPEKHRLRPKTPARILEEDDVVDLGNRSFEVLHLPGHSPGSIGLWEAKTGTLFSGDAVYDEVLLDELPGSNKEVYRKTMERLLSLPVNVVHGGHAASFGRDRLREIARAYLEGRSLEYHR